MVTPSTWLHLPLQFDVARMQQECDQFAATEWISHFNTGAYDTGWSCLPLRAPGGDAHQIMPIDGASYDETPQLGRCPYLRQVLRRFACELGAVRPMASRASIPRPACCSASMANPCILTPAMPGTWTPAIPTRWKTMATRPACTWCWTALPTTGCATCSQRPASSQAGAALWRAWHP